MDALKPQPDAPCAPIATITLRDVEVSPAFVARIPIGFARRFGIVGIDERDGGLTVAMGLLDRLAVAENVGVCLGMSVHPVLADEDEIQATINEAYSGQDSGLQDVVNELAPAEATEVLSSITSEGDLLDKAAKAPVIKLVNAVLFDAVKRRASDVHFQPYADRLQVRLRIDGVLYDYVARLNIAEKRLPQDGRTTVTVGDRIIDLRISTLPTSHGERVVLRLLDKSARLYELNALGMQERDLETFARLIRRTHGILLVTGPTGSGKTTTLYSALQELNSTELNIVTLEDPIEYQLAGISQTQVSDKKGMTFATGLRTVLRQDPDVIMVGEIRDEETARMAVQSSLTGHLVFSTLHTNDAAGAVARLLDLGVEPYLVAGSVIGVMAQRLVRRVCPQCRTQRALTVQERDCLGLGDDSEMVLVTEGQGCHACLQTGYFERVGVFELLEVNDDVRRLILDRAESARIKRAAVDGGMHTLRRDAIDKMLAGRTTVQEVLKVTHEDEVTS